MALFWLIVGLIAGATSILIGAVLSTYLLLRDKD